MTLCHFLGAKVRQFESKTSKNWCILIYFIPACYLFDLWHLLLLTN